MTLPTISVIMAAHNTGRYVDKAVQSVLGQSLSNLELIIVDDASTDDTARRLLALQAGDQRLLLIREGTNGGVSAARNRALSVARGKWIAIVDSDDWIEPERLLRLVRAAESLDVDWIADNQYLYRDTARYPSAYLMSGEPREARVVSAAYIVEHDPPGMMGYGLLKPVIRRDFIVQARLSYRSKLQRYEDFLLFVELAARAARFAILSEAQYCYRLRSDSLTRIDPRQVLREMQSVNAEARRIARNFSDMPLDRALTAREAQIKEMRRYFEIVMPWKEGRKRAALKQLIADWTAFPFVASKLSRRLWSRLLHYDPLGLVLLGGRSALLAPPDNEQIARTSTPTRFSMRELMR